MESLLPLAEKIAARLIERKETVAVAEGSAGGLISARAVGLSYGVLRTMILTKAKFVIALALSLAMLGGAGGLAYRSLAAGADDAPKTAPTKTASRDGRRPEADTDAEKILGTWLVVSAEQGGNEAPAEAIKDFTVVISADKIAFKPKGENNQFSYKLDPKKNPKVIEIANNLVQGFSQANEMASFGIAAILTGGNSGSRAQGNCSMREPAGARFPAGRRLRRRQGHATGQDRARDPTR